MPPHIKVPMHFDAETIRFAALLRGDSRPARGHLQARLEHPRISTARAVLFIERIFD